MAAAVDRLLENTIISPSVLDGGLCGEPLLRPGHEKSKFSARLANSWKKGISGYAMPRTRLPTPVDGYYF